METLCVLCTCIIFIKTPKDGGVVHEFIFVCVCLCIPTVVVSQKMSVFIETENDCLFQGFSWLLIWCFYVCYCSHTLLRLILNGGRCVGWILSLHTTKLCHSCSRTSGLEWSGDKCFSHSKVKTKQIVCPNIEHPRRHWMTFKVPHLCPIIIVVKLPSILADPELF